MKPQPGIADLAGPLLVALLAGDERGADGVFRRACLTDPVAPRDWFRTNRPPRWTMRPPALRKRTSTRGHRAGPRPAAVSRPGKRDAASDHGAEL